MARHVLDSIAALFKRVRFWLVIALLLALLAARVWQYVSDAYQRAFAFSPADIHRAGKLAIAQGGDGVALLDLSTGSQTRLFKPPANSLVTGAAFSPDGKTLVMAYAPPPTNSPIQFG